MAACPILGSKCASPVDNIKTKARRRSKDGTLKAELSFITSYTLSRRAKRGRGLRFAGDTHADLRRALAQIIAQRQARARAAVVCHAQITADRAVKVVGTPAVNAPALRSLVESILSVTPELPPPLEAP